MIRWNGIEVDVNNRTVKNNGLVYTFRIYHNPNNRFKLFQHVLMMQPVTMKRLYEKLYGYTINGDPSPKCIEVMMSRLRLEMRQVGIEVKAEKNGTGYKHYWLEP